MGDRTPSRPQIMRIAGFMEFVVAMIFAATPLLRSAVGDRVGYMVSGVMLFSSATLFVLARWMERSVAKGS